MLMLRIVTLVVFCLMLPLPAAASPYCPGPLAAISGGGVNPVVLPLMKSLYRELGCNLTVLPLPGRRGIVEFNAGRVSGELFRLPIIESSYTVDFVRSAVPILEVQEAIWIDPSRELTGDSLIGYVLGKKWQEDFAEQEGDRYQFVEYTVSAEVLTDFTRARLDGFLASQQTIDVLLKDGSLPVKPVMGRLIKSTQLYHYLNADFEPFMVHLSQLLDGQTPVLNVSTSN